MNYSPIVRNLLSVESDLTFVLHKYPGLKELENIKESISNYIDRLDEKWWVE